MKFILYVILSMAVSIGASHAGELSTPTRIDLAGVSADGFKVLVFAQLDPVKEGEMTFPTEFTGAAIKQSQPSKLISIDCVFRYRVSLTCLKAPFRSASPYFDNASFSYRHNAETNEHQYLCSAGCGPLVPAILNESTPIAFEAPPPPPPARAMYGYPAPASWDLATARAFLPVVVAPKYPRKERKAGIAGTTVLLFEYDKTGWAVRVTIQTSSGNENLDAAALKAVKQWRVKPGLKDGSPVAGKARIPITFAP